MLRLIKVLLLLVVLALGVVLAVKNDQNVQVNYLAGNTQLALFIPVLGGLVLGFLLGAALSVVKVVGLRTKLRRARKQLGKLESENEDLQNPGIENA